MKAHIRKTAPTALVWGFGPDQPGRSSLETLCAKAGLALKDMTTADLARSVGSLCDLPGPYPKAPVPSQEEFPPAIIFSSFADPELDQFLEKMKQENISIPLKALVTSINRQWPLAALLEELCEEHAAFQKGV